jgi:hypothetical protein
MKTTTTTADREYSKFLKSLQKNAPTEQLFTTDIPGEKLWAAYLASFAPSERQHYTCRTCRGFIEAYGGLVTIDVLGNAYPAFWGSGPKDKLNEKLGKLVMGSKVTGVFLSDTPTLGKHEAGGWDHIAVTLPSYHKHLLYIAEQRMAALKQDFGTLAHSLSDFKPTTIATALRILQTDSLFRGEKFIAPLEWFQSLHSNIERNRQNKANLIWQAVASAPVGFATPRSGLVGTLLEDIQAGLPFQDIAARFKAKMHPLQYLRPQAAPAEQTIDAAEKLVAKLGLEESFAIRYLPPHWTPETLADGCLTKEFTGPFIDEPTGIFASLKSKTTTPIDVTTPVPITWAKFYKDVILGSYVSSMELQLRPSWNYEFAYLTTLANEDAKPIYQWDTEERRNPVAHFCFHGGNQPHHVVEQNATGWYPVQEIVKRPMHWYGNEAPNFPEGVILLLKGARCTLDATLPLFPEFLKSELHPIRSVVEAFAEKGRVSGKGKPCAAGLLLVKGHPWSDTLVRVTTDNVRTVYKLDRWD